MFIKPCTATEIDFYESATQNFPEFLEVMPLFLGTLALSNTTEVTTAVDDIAAITTVVPETIEKSTAPAAPEAGDGVTWKPNKDKRIKTDQAIVLENLTSGYTKPNILDAKLGKRLWADDAPLEKRQRFNSISEETTHKNFGCRIAGMRIYKGSEDPAELDEEEYRIYDRDYGRVAVKDENFIDEVRRFVFNKAAGIDDGLGKAVCEGFARELKRVEEVLMAHETRMYSSSILFIFEGDGKALDAAIERNNTLADEIEAGVVEAGAVEAKLPDTIRLDSGIVMDGEDSDGESPDDKDPSNGGGPSDGKDPNGHGPDNEGSDSDETPLLIPKVHTLKLIDCAHAKWEPGQGPDENTLAGIRSLYKIFDDLSK